jgi:hypothetical protein
MSNLIDKTKSAYEYPLLIKQLFYAPLANKPEQKIIFRDIIQIVKASVDSGVLPREAITMKVQRADKLDKTSVGKTNKMALRARFT